MPVSFFIADTNIYVSAANDVTFRARFEAFIEREGPLFISAVVAAEVLIGIPDLTRHNRALSAVTAGGGLLTPESEDWTMAAAAVVRLGGEAVTKTRSFWNDALLAAQCARLNAGLLTLNAADFRRLGRVLPLEVHRPFPSSSQEQP